MVAARQLRDSTTDSLDAFDPSGFLAGRGLRDIAYNLGWQRQRGAWRYELLNRQHEVVGARIRRETGKPKYLWDGGKPDHSDSDFYLLPGVTHAVRANDGVCYLANGEMALLAMHAAGVKNSICTTHAEIVVHDEWAQYLDSIGVRTLINVADSDDAGRKSAVKWRDMLKGTGIAYQARQWSSELGAKADANDLWMHVNYDKRAFRDALEATDALPLPNESLQKLSYQHNDYASDGEYWQNYSELVNAVGQALGNDGRVGRDGWSRNNVCCPHHDDNEASAGFNYESGVLNCFACGSHSIKATADAVGVDWKPYVKRREYTRNRPSNVISLDAIPTTPTKPLPELPDDYDPILEDIQLMNMVYEDGNYKAWMTHDNFGMLSAMLNLIDSRKNYVLIFGKLNHAFRTGKLNWTCFTIKDAAKTIDMPRKAVSKTIDMLQKWGFVRLLGAYSIYNTMGSNLDQNPSAGGRPSKCYRVNHDERDLNALLIAMLGRHYIETYFDNVTALRTGTIAYDMLQEQMTFDEWKLRNDTTKRTDEYRQAAKELWKEFNGDGHEWRGWRAELADNRTTQLNWSSIHSIKTLRARILRAWVSEVRPDNTSKELERLLGCSDGTVINTRPYAGVNVHQRHAKPDYEYKDAEQQYINACRDHRGRVKKVGIKLKSEDKYRILSENLNDILDDHIIKNAPHRIERIFFNLQIPNLYEPIAIATWFTTLRGQFAVEMAFIEVLLKHIVNNATEYGIDPDELPEAIDIQITRSTGTSEDDLTAVDDLPDDDTHDESCDVHVWDTHTERWMNRQAALEVHGFTDWLLMSDARTIVNRHTWEHQTHETRDDVVAFVNATQHDDQQRTGVSWVDEQRMLDKLNKQWLQGLQYVNRNDSPRIKRDLLTVYAHIRTGFLTCEVASHSQQSEREYTKATELPKPPTYAEKVAGILAQNNVPPVGQSVEYAKPERGEIIQLHHAGQSATLRVETRAEDDSDLPPEFYIIGGDWVGAYLAQHNLKRVS